MVARVLGVVLSLLVCSPAVAQLKAGTDHEWNNQAGQSGRCSVTWVAADGVWRCVFFLKNEEGVEVEVGACDLKEGVGPLERRRYTATISTGISFQSLDATTAPSCAGVMADGNTGGLSLR
jgi:hypothetical protein